MKDDSLNSYHKILVHPSFYKTAQEINHRNINLPYIPIIEHSDFSSETYPNNNAILSRVESENVYSLDAYNGRKILETGIGISAYDESIERFDALEGVAFLTAHSLILHGANDYIPSVFMALNFYTRSRLLTKDAKYIKYSENPESSRKEDYVNDRSDFLLRNVPENSILFIDGPLIGGQISSQTTLLNELLIKKEIIPFFVVKNSSSNLVTDYIEDLKGKFNSDMHWAHKTLKPGERTRFFQYVDAHNPKNGKVFCYLKCFDQSPQRIEFQINTYHKYKDIILSAMDLIYYLILAQGDFKNPQLRSIAISEKYARETISLFNLEILMKRLGITATINQNRFGQEEL